MDTQTQREEALFDAAFLLKPEERAAFLARECGSDLDLRKQVEALLRAHDKAATFLENSPLQEARVGPSGTVKLPTGFRPSPTRTLTEKPGDYIGRYKLLQKIGEGGCGVVYMAEQEAPVRRRVALKIIKLGMDTNQVIARFEAERQALAMMDHPNIARVLDAGATETGRPYFVMDLVRGTRITEYSEKNNLTTEQRLELFMRVCHGVQHAHQKGIIHRDLKPSNILVTIQDGTPVPVLIDFGIAKATEQRLTEKTLFTAFEQFIGTPAYMSPEQAAMSRADLDTRSDIYALGVLLYELLTGRTPFDPRKLQQAGLDEIRRTIRETEPLRPSTCLSTMAQAELSELAKHQQAEPLRLIHRVRGDLDWIVMKCLEKERSRRYQTASDLAADIQRHLDHEPVLARPPSQIYRLQKLIQRHKVTCTAVAAVSLAVLIGLGVSTHLFLLERQARRRTLRAEQLQRRLREDAERAQASEAQERHRSEENARQSRLSSYAADVSSAFLALQADNLGRAADLLQRQVPQTGAEDLRGFAWRYLWQQAQGDELLSLTHPGLVSCALFAPDRRSLITACYDGAVRVWDLATQRVLHRMNGFEQRFGWRYLALSPDGKRLAAVQQGRLLVWAADQAAYPVLFETNFPARVLAFTPQGSTLVGWGAEGLLLLDMEQRTIERLRTKLRPASYPALAIDRSGKLAAVAHEGNRNIEIWDLDSRMLTHSLSVTNQTEPAFVSLAWSPEGLLAATTWAGRLLLIDSRTGDVLASIAAHQGSVFGVAFSNDGQSLVTAGHDQLIQVWQVPTLQKRMTLRGHTDEIWSLEFSADGQQLCTAGKDGTAKVWGLKPKPAPVYLSDWYVGQFSADGKAFISLAEPTTEVTLDLWDVGNPRVHTTKTLPVGEVTNLVRIVLSADARLLAAAKSDGSVEIWSVDEGKLLQTTRQPDVSEIAFSPQAELIGMGTAHGTVRAWNWKTGTTQSFATQGVGRIAKVNFSPGGRFIRATREPGSTEMLCDLQTGKVLVPPVAPGEVWLITSDDSTLASSDAGYDVRLWNLPSLTPRAALRGHRWTVASIASSKDGKLLATGSLDATARLWDVTSGTEICPPLRGHLQGVTQLAFAPDGRTLATGSTDSSVKVWHVPTGRELFNLADASDPAFSPDGNTLRVKTSQGTRLIHVPSLAEIDVLRTTRMTER